MTPDEETAGRAALDKAGARWDCLAFVGGGSDKFYRLRSGGTHFGGFYLESWWGRNGAEGQKLVKKFPDQEDAEAEHVELLRSKLKKGYNWAIVIGRWAQTSVAPKNWADKTPGERLRQVLDEQEAAKTAAEAARAAKQPKNPILPTLPSATSVPFPAKSGFLAGTNPPVGSTPPVREIARGAIGKKLAPQPPAPPKPAAVQGIALGRFAVLVHGDDDEEE